MFVARQGRELGHPAQHSDQLRWLCLRDDVHINGQPPDRVQAQKQACATLELERQPAFRQMANKLDRENGLLEHHGVWRPNRFPLPPQPVCCKALWIKHLLIEDQSTQDCHKILR